MFSAMFEPRSRRNANLKFSVANHDVESHSGTSYGTTPKGFGANPLTEFHSAGLNLLDYDQVIDLITTPD